MKFIQHYSGSKGNLYEVVSNDGKRLLIEAGVVWPTLQKALKYDLKGISGCLLSHEHQDHSKAIKDVMRAGIDVYASYNTLDVLDIAGKRRANVLNTRKRIYWLSLRCIIGSLITMPLRSRFLYH